MKKESLLKKLGESNIDIYDIKILVFTFGKVLSVSDLQKEVNMAYKNLLPHLKKLRVLDLISIKDFGRGKKKEVTSKVSYRNLYFIFGLLALNTSEEKLKSYPSLYKEITNFIQDNQIED